MPDTDEDFKSLILIGMATTIRLLLRDYRDDGKDAIDLAVALEKAATELQDRVTTDQPMGPNRRSKRHEDIEDTLSDTANPFDDDVAGPKPRPRPV